MLFDPHPYMFLSQHLWEILLVDIPSQPTIIITMHDYHTANIILILFNLTVCILLWFMICGILAVNTTKQSVLTTKIPPIMIHNGMQTVKIIHASHAYSIRKFMNTKLKLLNCNANIYFNRNTKIWIKNEIKFQHAKKQALYTLHLQNIQKGKRKYT
jgi:hypothetical protein